MGWGHSILKVRPGVKGYQVIAIMLGVALVVSGLWGLGVVIVCCALYDRFVGYG